MISIRPKEGERPGEKKEEILKENKGNKEERKMLTYSVEPKNPYTSR